MRHLLLTALALLCSAAPALAAPWVLTPNQPFFPTSPEPADAQREITLAAGRGEVEGAVVLARPERRQRITPRPGALTSDAGVIPAERISISRIGYVPVTRPSTGVPRLQSDEYPDPVYDIRPGRATALPANVTSALLVEVDVPPEQAPGIYTGEVVLGTLGSVPIRIEILDVLIDRDRRPFLARIDVYAVARHYGVDQTDPRLLAGMTDQVMPMLRAHGIGPGVIPGSVPVLNPLTWEADWTGLPRERIDKAEERGFPWIEMPYMEYYGGLVDRKYTDPRRKQMARQIANAYRPLKAKLFTLPVDEPSNGEYPIVIRAAKQLRAADSPAQMMVTEAPTPLALKQLNPYVDIWTPPIWNYYMQADQMETLRAQGKQTWWYLYGSDAQRHAPNLLIDKPMTEPRVLGWAAEAQQVGATLYWSLTAWRHKKTRLRNPLRTPWRISHHKKSNQCESGSREVGGNGEGTLLYPSGNIDRPLIRSLRVVAIRDGLEDQSLINALTVKSPKAAARFTDAVSHAFSGQSSASTCNRVARPVGVPIFTTAPKDVIALRTWLIDQLQGRTGTTITGKVTHDGAPVRGASVRAAGMLAITDVDGDFRLKGLPSSELELTISRDREGRVDPVVRTLEKGELAGQPLDLGRVELPVRTERSLQVSPRDLSAWQPRRKGARIIGSQVEWHLAYRYRKDGLPASSQRPDVHRTFRAGQQDWSGYRFLRLTLNLINRGPKGQPWRLLITPCGAESNTRRLVLAQGVQQVEIPLAGMRGLADVECLDVGVRSALPPGRRSNHKPRATLRLRDLTLVR